MKAEMPDLYRQGRTQHETMWETFRKPVRPEEKQYGSAIICSFQQAGFMRTEEVPDSSGADSGSADAPLPRGSERVYWSRLPIENAARLGEEIVS